jgi:hypothetical protein
MFGWQKLIRYGIQYFLLSIFGALLCRCAMGQTTTRKIPFSSVGIRSIVGKDICDFEGQRFLAGTGVDLDLKKEYAVVNLVSDDGNVVGIFLLRKPTLRCGIVDASLDVSHVIRKGELVELKCYTAHEGGTTWPKWGHIIGLANGQNGTKRVAKARLAWRVDVVRKRFEELKNQSVTCDMTGYDD